MSKEAIKLALEAFETLTQYNMVRANIFRRFEPTCTGDYVDLKEFREKAEPAITALREALAEQPAAVHEMTNIERHERNLQKFLAEQPAQQEPVAKDNGNYRLDPPKLDPLYTSPQPAQQLPDAIHHTDTSEHPEYISGWNECRKAVLEAAQQPAQRKPLTDEQITKGWWIPEEAPQTPRDGFVAGVRFAESAHNIKEQP